MQTLNNYQQESWFIYLAAEQQSLVDLSLALADREKQTQNNFSDYSFLVFPASKAYEGFLKKYLFEQRLISLEIYNSRRFRIGRALNPDLKNHLKDEQWLFDDVALRCGQEIARQMWDTWLKCRNRVFHYFPDEKNLFLNLEQAEERIYLIIDTISKMLERSH